MTVSDEQLSAFLDRELPADRMRDIDALLAVDPDLCDRLAALRGADAFAARRLAALLEEPVPLALARAIAAKQGRSWAGSASVGWSAVAGAAAGALVASALFMIALPTAPAVRTWTDEIADYHRVYAKEDRHLVEVGPEESDHVRAWLGARIGRAFAIPDLSEHGLSYRGARLLVASGAPVAQLVYTLQDSSVFALCLTPRPDQPDQQPNTARLDEFDAVTLRQAGTAIVLLGPAGRLDLQSVWQTAEHQL